MNLDCFYIVKEGPKLTEEVKLSFFCRLRTLKDRFTLY